MTEILAGAPGTRTDAQALPAWALFPCQFGGVWGNLLGEQFGTAELGAAMILAVVEDLIFLSKIQETSKALGITIEAASAAAAMQRAREGSARALVIDLNHRSGEAVALVRQLKSDPATAAVPVVGFLSHVQAELAAAARAAGCDMVLARSAFVKQLPELLKRLAGREAAAPPPSN